MNMHKDTGEPQVTSLLDSTRAFLGSPEMSDTTDVVIIGGGIVGCSAAYFLTVQGLRVVVCEKGRIAGEQSGRNWGWVRQQGRASAELPMMMRSNAIWRSWVDELDTGFVQGGCLYLARTNKELDELGDWLVVAKEHDLQTTIIKAKKLSEILLGAGDRWAGALYTPSDGRAEPNRATSAIAQAAIRQGAVINENCAVRGLETEAGKVARVITEHGSVRTSSVICAAGAWTSLFAGSLGITLPQLKIKGTVARTSPTVSITEGAVWAPDVAIRRRRDGGYTVAHGSAMEHSISPSSFRFGLRFLPAMMKERDAIRVRLNSDFLKELKQSRRWALDKATLFEKTRILSPPPSEKILKEIKHSLATSFPEIKDVPFVETWAGMIEATPDLMPIIGEANGLPGFYIATGFSGHGFGLGPGAGECVANLVTGNETHIDTHPFRLNRYFDGSKIELGPTV